MPCSNDRDPLDEYSEILLEISGICLVNNTDFIVMGGDWNADLSRNDGRTKLFKEFIKNENLFNALDSEAADVEYTWFSRDESGNRVGSVSTIDHFIVSPSLKNSIREYKSELIYSNGSDHVPLLLTLDIDIQLHNTHTRDFKPSVAWHNCDSVKIGKYQSELDSQLLQINPCQDAWKCSNRKCKDHHEFIQSEHSKLINLWLEASNRSLPHTTNNND